MSIRINGTYRPSTANKMEDKSHNTFHVTANPELYELQRSNNFEVLVFGLEGVKKAGYTDDDNSANSTVGGDVQETLRLSVESFNVPQYQQAPITIKRGNTEIKYAGTMTWSAGSMKIVDYIGLDSKEALRAWQNLSGNTKTGKVGLVSDYKKQCSLIEYTPDWQIVRTWKLYGCWISDIQEDAYSADTNGKHNVTATIQFDRAEIDR